MLEEPIIHLLLGLEVVQGRHEDHYHVFVEVRDGERRKHTLYAGQGGVGADKYGVEVVGFTRGYSGLFKNTYRPLDLRSVSGIMHEGGTILKSSNKDNLAHHDHWQHFQPQTLHELTI